MTVCSRLWTATSGVIWHDKLDFSIYCEAQSMSAGRALGSIINKIHALKDSAFSTFDKLFNSCVGGVECKTVLIIRQHSVESTGIFPRCAPFCSDSVTIWRYRLDTQSL